jgi:hypothetical protein
MTNLDIYVIIILNKLIDSFLKYYEEEIVKKDKKFNGEVST